MAYSKELTLGCQNSLCSKRAVIEVFSWRNSSYGLFCRPCGNRKLRQMKADEKTGWEQVA